MITSTPVGRFVHWKGMKPFDLPEAEDRLVAHLESLPFQEGRLSVFNRLPTEGYTQGGKFWARRRRDQKLEGARNTKLR
jgi:hypothetical protein